MQLFQLYFFNFCQVYEHVYETVDIQGNPEVRAQATAKVSLLVHIIQSNLHERLPLHNGHLSTMPINFLFGRQSIHSFLFQLLYSSHSFTMAIFFCPQGGHCREVQLQSLGLVERVKSWSLWLCNLTFQ